MEYLITAAWKGRTVKDYLYTVVGVSRSVLIRLKKKEDGIMLNGSHVTVRAVLAEGDLLQLSIYDEAELDAEKIVPRNLPFEIVYEDEWLIVANKPANMPTHPTHGHYEDTLANAVAFYMQKKGVCNFVFRAVNRLDRDTSGLVIIAKNQLSCAKLGASLQEGKIVKNYLALLNGFPMDDNGLINKPIRRTSDSIITRQCCEDGEGASALTKYRVLKRYDGYSLVLASPITGRTHQLRVHFSFIGCPILGDTLYGDASEGMGRQALHAVGLRFPHPMEEREVSVSCLPPEDMLKWIKEYDFNEINAMD